MDHELDVDVIFHDPDPVANTQTVTLNVPAHINPDTARKLFLNAILGVAGIEKESK